MSRPLIEPTSSSRIRRPRITWPSYSSPWVPALRTTVGPAPLANTAIGTGTTPYAF